jgi:hypothetical protein
LCLAGDIVAVFGGFVSNQSEDSSNNVANGQFVGLGFD